MGPEASRRGCQLSLRVVPNASGGGAPLTMRALEEALREEHGVVGDAREPDILRISPAPLYNSFEDAHRVVDALQKCLKN